jgi:hypothetical protein
MIPEEYNRKFRKTPGSLPQEDEPAREVGGEVILPVEADESESRRQLDEAGYDYGGEEGWIEFMRRMGRL